MEFLLIASAHFLALLSPGPDFFLIMQASLRLPKRYGFAISAGIAVANGVYILLAVAGTEIVRQIGGVLSLLQYCGAAYLLFLGVMLLRTPKQSLAEKESSSFLSTRHIGRQFLIGFLSGILNPKNVIFYLSLFTVIVSGQTPFPTKCFYGVWMMSAVFFWDCFVVLLIGRVREKGWLENSVYLVEKIAGVVLIAFGVVLPFSS